MTNLSKNDSHLLPLIYYQLSPISTMSTVVFKKMRKMKSVKGVPVFS